MAAGWNKHGSWLRCKHYCQIFFVTSIQSHYISIFFKSVMIIVDCFSLWSMNDQRVDHAGLLEHTSIPVLYNEYITVITLCSQFLRFRVVKPKFLILSWFNLKFWNLAKKYICCHVWKTWNIQAEGISEYTFNFKCKSESHDSILHIFKNSN